MGDVCGERVQAVVGWLVGWLVDLIGQPGVPE